MHLLEIEIVAFDSPFYHQAITLRQLILRTPLGLVFTEEALQQEKYDYHVLARQGETVVGCLVLASVNPQVLKMRQVAIASSMQGKGLGKQLVLWAEQFAQMHGYNTITMHARESAVGFYKQLGYQVLGDVFTEVTLPHWVLEKQLQA